MLNFGLIGGFGGKSQYCPRPPGELLYNWTFDCGVSGWGFDPAYPATLTDNGDGSVHLKTDSNFGSLVPTDGTYPGNTYIIEVSIRNQIGNGKISFRRPNGTWVSTPTLGDGVHQSDVFTGEVREIHVGADGDNTYEADYDYISLKVHVAEVLTTDSGETLTTDNGEEITIWNIEKSQ